MTARRFSCAITFDFDAMSLWIGSLKAVNPSMISRGEFGAVAVPRILDLLRRYGVRSTWCVPGHTALAYPDLVRRVRDEGHELAHHGWVHENPAGLDEAGERHVLERGLEALEEVAGVRVRGYRFGIDEPYVFGTPTRLIELPVTWGLDDFPPCEFVIGMNSGLHAPSQIEEIWKGDFDWGYANVPGGLLTLTLHPQVIGRGHRMLLLERLLEHFTRHEGVVFETLGGAAARFAAENPVR